MYVTTLTGGVDVGKYNGIFYAIHNSNLTVGMLALSIIRELNIPFDLKDLPKVCTVFPPKFRI